MVNRERKIIEYAAISVDIEYGTIGSAIEELQRLAVNFGEDARIDWYEPPYTDNRYLYVYAKRPETDEEMQSRILQEERWEKMQETRDRAEFDRLQKKFGNAG